MDTTELKTLLDRLVQLLSDIADGTKSRLNRYSSYFPEGEYTASAINLASYLALRQNDLCELQDELSRFGMYSLGRSEAYVVDNLNKVIQTLTLAVGDKAPVQPVNHISVNITRGMHILEQHTQALFGATPTNRKVRIMVTLAANAGEDYELVRDLLQQGMDCARINCAHDDDTTWLNMINNVHRAATETGKPCRIVMDLAGQKLRTGKIQDGPAVHHLKVKHDSFGKVVAPAKILLYPVSQPPPKPTETGCKTIFHIGIDDTVFDSLTLGGRLAYIDIRGKHRRLDIVTKTTEGVLCDCWNSAYITPDTRFKLQHNSTTDQKSHDKEVRILQFTPAPAEIRMFRGDTLLLTRSDVVGKPAGIDPHSGLSYPAQIAISHDEALDMLAPGKTVWIDDGKLGAVVQSLTPAGALLQVTHTGAKGVVLHEDKGINFPDTELRLPPLTNKDLKDLDFICQHADLVSYSFVQSSDDITLLLEQLTLRNAAQLPIIAKIETKCAVKNLADIILGSIGRTKLGVMIARGDLAVELGSVRLAEIQEEILWLCEAAHVPVVWATQVLETMAKQGTQSRPEITDAAMGVRAECVMLNKGPYIIDALRILSNILMRMETHQRKKFSRLRALHQWPLELDSQQTTENPGNSGDSILNSQT